MPAATFCAVLDQPFDPHVGIERAKERFRDRQARNDDRVAAVHHAAEPRIGRDDGDGGYVTSLAQILGKGRADERLEIEAGQAPAGREIGAAVTFFDLDSGGHVSTR